MRKDLLDSMNHDPDHSNEIFREISAEEWKTAIVDTIRYLRHVQKIYKNEVYKHTTEPLKGFP